MAQTVSVIVGTQDRARLTDYLDSVREIIQLPDQVSEVARSETAVLGVVTLRGRLLPLVSLRALLGLPLDSGRDGPGPGRSTGASDGLLGRGVRLTTGAYGCTTP